MCLQSFTNQATNANNMLWMSQDGIEIRNVRHRIREYSAMILYCSVKKNPQATPPIDQITAAIDHDVENAAAICDAIKTMNDNRYGGLRPKRSAK